MKRLFCTDHPDSRSQGVRSRCGPRSLAIRLVALAAVASVFVVDAAAHAQELSAYPGDHGVPESNMLRNMGFDDRVARPPIAPTAAARPASWPGEAPPSAAAGAGAGATYPGTAMASAWPAVPAVAAPRYESCTTAEVVANVGAEAILVGDLAAFIDDALQRNGKELSDEQREVQRRQLTNELNQAVKEADRDVRTLDQAQLARRAMLKQMLKQVVETKLVFLDAKHTIPSENFPNIEKQVYRYYEQNELATLMKRAKVESWRELDQYLRQHGTSFERERRSFLERSVSQQWMHQQLKLDEEITLNQMLGFYQEHPHDFDIPTSQRWQMIAVSFSQFMTKREAFAAMAAFGNRVMAGEDFAAVAAAAPGGESLGSVQDWPDASKRLPDCVVQAIEGLPPGQMSPVLEDWRGCYIVRVVERTAARHETFEESQNKIRDKIRAAHANEKLQKYLADLKARFPVWTVLDGGQPAPNIALQE